MAKFILIDKGTIANEISPTVPVVICVDKSLAKWVLKVMNDEHAADRTNLMLKEDIKTLKRKIIALEQKLSRRDKYIQENNVSVPGKMSSEIENKHAKKHKETLSLLKRKDGIVSIGEAIHTQLRGTTQTPVASVSPEQKVAAQVVEKPPRPKVEDVLRMEDGPEKQALEAQFTLAEKIEASKLRYKIEREKWKAMRDRGFGLDNPIIGTGC